MFWFANVTRKKRNKKGKKGEDENVVVWWWKWEGRSPSETSSKNRSHFCLLYATDHWECSALLFSLSFHFPSWLFLLPLFFSSLCAFPPFLQFPVTVQNSQNNKLKKGRPTVFEKREEQSQDRYQHHDTMHSNTVINLPLFLMTK